jgi:hypothetical protein
MRIIIREMGIYRIQNILLRKENPKSHAIYFCKKKMLFTGKWKDVAEAPRYCIL